MDEEELSAPTRRWRDAGRVLQVGGHELFVVERGAGPVLLLLHGFPTSAHDYRNLVERLSDAHRCIAPDLPGYGLSHKPVAYSYSLFQQADAVEALLAALAVQRAHVVCHDMATSVVCELLARRAEGRLGFEPASVTLTNGSMLMWRARITPFQALLASNDALEQGMSVCEGMSAELFVEGLKRIMKRPECVSAEDATVIGELLLYREGNRRLPAIAGYMRERYVHRDRWLGALRNTNVPLQLVWADGDPIAHVEMGRELRDMLSGARYTELDGVGHFLITEDPERVAALVRDFVAAQRL